ncbi:MAG TPA: GTP-binding protein, partial [Spirochaetota bacterium]|nr:GTP-binding protein [Spirochaetota bacterium]
MPNLSSEIKKRKTFGIISHPNAGKTTLTEKFLLFGGAINTAGAIKARKSSRYAASDFMEIEKQRGISVATAVMGFSYRDIHINLLDTPGHEDFCEDTYRTLTAVDSAVMVIDCAKGVEPQTEKLLEVCRMRNTPVITFINKLDREGRDAVELLDEVEAKLKIKVVPLSWPVGMGKNFKGVYNIYRQQLILYQPHARQDQNSSSAYRITDLKDKKLDELIGPQAAELREHIELISGVYPDFNKEKYLDGHSSP